MGAKRDERGAWLPALSPAELRQGVEDNLRSLRVERMDLVNLRVADETGGPGEPISEQVQTLVELRDEGKLDLIGVSNVTLEGAQWALEQTDIGEIQNSYSVIDRGNEPILDLCREHEIAFVPFFPLGSAFAGGPAKLAADPAISQVAGKHDATPSQVALAWLLAHYERILLIPGTTSVAHLEENLGAAEVALGEDDMATLELAEQVGRQHA